MTTPASLSLTALGGMPEVRPGAPLVPLIAAALTAHELVVSDQDAMVVCQKIVSKSEGRFVDLDAIEVSDRARELARGCGKDPRLVEIILRESLAIVRCAPQVLIVRHRSGLVMANAGVDQSNVPGSEGRVLLLPRDPDESAERLREGLHQHLGVAPAVIVTDSFGRPWRRGVCGAAIGAAGIVTLLDRRGERDRCGRELKVTQVAVADAVAAAAALLMGEGAEGRPVVLARGLLPGFAAQSRSAVSQAGATGDPSAGLASGRLESSRAADLIRPVSEDLFR